MTWHEDREVNPGVPDLSYVVKPGNFETGWLELKRVLPSPATCDARPQTSRHTPRPDEKIKFELEASQHQWISQHHHRVPVHFLLGYGAEYYLLDGRFHRDLVKPVTIHQLRHWGNHYSEADLRVGLAEKLAEFTDRYRHVE